MDERGRGLEMSLAPFLPPASFLVAVAAGLVSTTVDKHTKTITDVRNERQGTSGTNSAGFYFEYLMSNIYSNVVRFKCLITMV